MIFRIFKRRREKMVTLCPSERIRNVSPDTVKEAIETKDVILLDVREHTERVNGHIKGSLHIPLRELPYRANELPRDKEIVTYCRSGNRSLGAAMYLCAQGFDNVANMEGGIIRWPYGITRSAN
jgi:rhodanese-related sulfurtransferase